MALEEVGWAEVPWAAVDLVAEVAAWRAGEEGASEAAAEAEDEEEDRHARR